MERNAKFISILIACILLSGCLNCKVTENESTWESVKNKGIIIIGMSSDLFPISYIDKNNEFSGFAVDLMKEASARLGLQASIKDFTSNDAIAALNEGEIDMVLVPADEVNSYKLEINFAETFIVERKIIAVRKNAAILNKGDINGKVVGILSNSGINFLEINSFETIDFSNTEQALDALIRGDIDAVIGSEMRIRYCATKRQNEIVVLNEILDSKKYQAFFRKENKALSDKMKKTLNNMKKDGSFFGISANWFGIGLQ